MPRIAATRDPAPDKVALVKGAARKVKKYANRKLYDELEARYVSMVELAETVWSGADVEVVEDRTGRDVTAEVLARALYERIKRHRGSRGRSVEKQVDLARISGLLASLIRQVATCPRIVVRNEGGRP